MENMKITKTLTAILTTAILASCGIGSGGGGGSTSDLADTAVWSTWTPTNAATSVFMITQTRDCDVTVIGNADDPTPTCPGSAETSQTRAIENPLAADTAVWGAWTPTNAATSVLMVTQTRDCNVTVIGDIDVPAPTCEGGGSVSGGSQTRVIENPLAADTAAWNAWTPTNAATSVFMITQTRDCEVTVIGNADDSAPTCPGSIETSQTRAIENPLAADTASWGLWSQWSPASNTDTSVLSIMQSRSRNCMATIIGLKDVPSLTCAGSTSTVQVQTRAIENPLAADTAVWSAWTPTNAATSVLMVTQTRDCNVTVIGNADDPAPTCPGSIETSQTRTIENPLAADTAAWNAWTPTNAATSVFMITQTRDCEVTVIGNADDPAPTCPGSIETSQTRTIENPLAADTASWGLWSQWTPASNTDTSVLSIMQSRSRNCMAAIIGLKDVPALTCAGSTSTVQVQTRAIENPLAADTASWSAWTPANNADTSVLTITQTRVCEVTVIGIADFSEPTCEIEGVVANSETRTIDNPSFLAGLAHNGVTIICDALAEGESFSVSGTTYVKRSRAEITTEYANTSCTSGIVDMSTMFAVGSGYGGTFTFNADISHWDTSSVNNMQSMFDDAHDFNADIGYWDTSSVTDMSDMFRDTNKFNQNIGNWDTSSVNDMNGMFRNALAFNQNISSWDTSSVTDMSNMFDAFIFSNTPTFSQDLSGWCVEQISTTPTSFVGLDTNPDFDEAKHPNWGESCE